jgi:hypothetical protein
LRSSHFAAAPFAYQRHAGDELSAGMLEHERFFELRSKRAYSLGTMGDLGT